MSVFPIGRPFLSEPSRVRQFPSGRIYGSGPVAYVCDREMRVESNRGLFFAAELANDRKVPLVAVGISDTSWSYGNFRHLSSEAGSFADMERRLSDRGVPLFPFFGDHAAEAFSDFLKDAGFSALAFDFSPLSPQLEFRKRAADVSRVPVFEVDSRCAVACRTLSEKAEIGARTLRPKFWKAFVPPQAVEFGGRRIFEFSRFPDVETPYA